MAKITRIKASDTRPKEEASDEPAITRKKVVVKDKKSEKDKRKEMKKVEKTFSEKKTGKKPFILFRPFVALFNYIKESWHEIRQVRWPNRKTTWKMLLGMVVYTAFFVVVIFLLDLFFSWLFNLILSK
ncbi:preprotein translocase subunit SecE [Candidatus Saccharibacteria bacterium]|nr:preprotein translocase subunit SecE [Candidatus Saccharibacteria bacterium]